MPTTVAFRIDDALHQQLASEVERTGETRTAIMTAALLRDLTRRRLERDVAAYASMPVEKGEFAYSTLEDDGVDWTQFVDPA